ncbi:MAG: hypothetical protein SOW20_07690 [Berryella intestinalis]|uniref:hypothetical protein n=1 Tax=Berryella intestinalis TaxID=1531429 RepID=UPI002A4E5768|nr:hypothetical protein [Berryella intestinalis]MDD7369021.1 hypothetical protein [Berryella intestinalis]MDY3129888.1 hypothetical protein [Berryella intestinalis]
MIRKPAHPIVQARQIVEGFANAHPLIVALGAGAFVAAGTLLIVWLLVFSGLTAPVQFVYDNF